jgi:hypothetical protein
MNRKEKKKLEEEAALKLKLEEDEKKITEDKDRQTLIEKREQERKKLEEKNALNWRLRKEKIAQDKIKAKELFKKSLLEPNIKKNLIVWIDKYNNGKVYEGLFAKEKCFEIKRGIILFSLKIIHDELKIDNRSNNSIDLIKLQEKANNILLNNPEFLRKFKPIS